MERMRIASPRTIGLQNSHVDVVPLGDSYLVSMKLCFMPGRVSTLVYHSENRKFEHQLTQGVRPSLDDAIELAMDCGTRHHLPVLVRREGYDWFERELLYAPPGWQPKEG
jgi:hypothetical protein